MVRIFFWRATIVTMVLSDKTIKKLIAEGTLVIEGINESQIQPASIDCRIGRHYLVTDDTSMTSITFDKPITYREVESDAITIPPHSFLLATTMEYFKLPDNVTAFVEGRSSIGRMGLFIQNAGWVDPGFEGEITLELYNANSLPITIPAGRRVGQLVLCSLDQAAEKPYRGKYQGQRKATGSRIYNDEEVKHI